MKIKVKELLDKKNISRYRLQQLTKWNYRRVNAYYFSRVKQVNLEELDMLCEIFECKVEDLLEK